ncbi:hypothetical protein MATL_G00084540 [Megalops atlanticus]|uniref:Aryl hydrocarbon receptor n=1 Tax=Megalops atlanticus TaxID=7932 RepID=A0A9D3T773_MEGAT|nr:hypothetical protein MATL_G00084540 [Megalops atlanticus]
MLGNVGIYAAKKRKKPVQKIPKPPPPEGAKSNPSKRHRDRLNGELDKLTNLLPFSEDVRSRLDKLSVLRLSVGYLKVKSFFSATLKKNNSSWLGDGAAAFGGNGKSTSSTDGVTISEGEFLLQALNGFVLVVTAEGYVFYASPTIQDYLGFHQSDVVHQSVFELIHTDDRAMFRRQLHFALNPNQLESEQEDSSMQSSSQISSNIVTYDPQHIPPENSSFLERSFCCRFRCLLDNSSGFLALNFQGRLKYLHGQNKMAEDGTRAHSQLALFAIATPLQTPSILEIRTKTLIFQTKHKLDFTPMGIDTRGKVVLGYSEMELCMRGSGYQFIHAADMMYCADNHVRMIKTGESGFTVFRLLAKNGVWVWVQANARLVFKGGRPDFIVARQRPLTNEEGEENLRKRRLQLPFNFATGEALLYDTGPSLDVSDIPGCYNVSKIRKMPEQKALDPNSLLGAMLNQDQSIYIQTPESDPQCSLDQAFMDSHALVSVPGDAWHQGPPQSNGSIKHDPTVAGIMESLEQIMSDSNIGATLQDLDVNEMELKDWENTLLRMNTKGDMSDIELNDIFSNDIFSFVEETLFSQNAASCCSNGSNQFNSLGTVPPNCFSNSPLGNQRAFVGPSQSLPAAELQNGILPANQTNHQNAPFSDPQRQGVAVPQTGFIRMGEQSLMGKDGVRGMQKVPHVGIRANGPIGAQSTDLFSQSLRQPQLNAQNSSHSNLMPFNSAQGGVCFQGQNQVRHSVSSSQTSKLNGLGPCPQKKVRSASSSTTGQVHSSSLVPPFQNQQQLGMPAQQFECHQQNFTDKSSHMALNQENQWVPSIPDSNIADSLLEACTTSDSSQQGLLNPSPAAHLQGHFSVQTQSLQAQGLQSWQQRQQVPTAMRNGQQRPGTHMRGCYSQAQELQRDPTALQNQRPGYSYGTPKPVESPSTPTNSCMFDNAPPSVNRVQFNSMGLGASMSLYQNMKPPHSHSPPQASCCFQRNATDPIAGPQNNPQEDGLSCQMTPSFTPGDLMTQPQYLSCNEQMQIPGRPLEDNGSFSFPPLSNGTTYFSENNQTNCCDF